MPHFQTPDGLNLAYDITGSGTPLLCLAGLTRDMRDFEPVVEGFADRAQIIRLDSRGRGGSDHDPTYANYNLLQESQDAIALLDHLGLEQAAILGTSRGGLIAMTLALTHHARLAGVCLVDVGPVIDPAGLTFIMGYLGLPPKDPRFEAVLKALPKRYGASFPNVPEETWAKFIRRVWNVAEDGTLSLSYDPNLRKAVEEQMTGGEMPDIWPLFDALAGVPLALIRGENSDLLTRETVAEMQSRRPDMRFGEVKDRGHVPFLDEPESIALISDFLDML